MACGTTGGGPPVLAAGFKKYYIGQRKLSRMALPRLLPLVLLLALPVATAQGQVMPDSEVSVSLATPPDTIAPGGNASVPVTVSLTIRNAVCAQDTATTVDLEVAGTPSVPGLTATLAATSLEFIVPAGPQTNYNEDAETTLDITLAPTAAGNATTTYTVTASFGGNVCNGIGAVPAAEGTAEMTLAAEPPAPMPGEEDGEEDGEGGGGGGGKKGIPGPAPPVLLIGLAALAAAIRRR